MDEHLKELVREIVNKKVQLLLHPGAGELIMELRILEVFYAL